MDSSGNNYICIIDEMLIQVYRTMLVMEDKSKIRELLSNFEKIQNPISAIARLK